jgi:RHS repeat-associated protein
LPLPNITSANLNDIAIKSGVSKAYVAGASGTLISIPDLDNPVPVMANPKPAGDFKGVSFTLSGNDVFVVGNGAAVYNYNGASGAKVNGVYTPALVDVSFVNAMDGYVIGDKLVRYTPDGGANWNYVSRTSTVAMNAVATYAPGKALIVGASGYLGKANGTAVADSTTTGTYYDIEFSGATGYMVGTSAQRIRFNPTTYVPTYSTPAGTFPAGSTFRAVHIFRNGAFITAGDAGKIYCNNTSWVSIPLLSGTPNLKDIYFHDDRNGYVVGDGGAIYRCAAIGDVFGYLSPPASPWTAVLLTGTNGSTAPGSTNLTSIAFADRYKGFIGGYMTTGTPINFARVVNDESKLFTSRFWYDALGRLVLSQNTKQYNRKNLGTQTGRSDYSYTLYDALGRITEVGEKTDSTATGLVPFAGIFGDYVGGRFNPYVINQAAFTSWVNTGSVRREVTHTYYDNALSSVPSGVSQLNLRKRVSTVTYEDRDDGNATTYQHGTYYSYDIHGNVNTLWQHNKQLSVSGQDLKRIDYEYDLISGKVNLVRYQDGKADCFYHYYTYDADNRIREVYTSSYPWQGQLLNQRFVENNKLWSKDAKYFYYAHGPLARVEMGENQSQGIDYAYTLQGWIKGVNSNILSPNNDIGNDGLAATANKDFGRDAFGYSLSYYTGDYKPIDATNKWNTVSTRFEADKTGSYLLAARKDLFNGNISAMVTNMEQPFTYSSAANQQPTLQPQGSAYRYDQLNRIKNAESYININTATNVWAGSGLTVLQYANSFTYDGNGNILTQKRSTGAGQVDDLSYKYKRDGNGNLLRNQLDYVTDQIGSAVATDDIDTQLDSNYRYDELGNLKRDLQEQILRIEWTVYGKIKKVIRTTSSTKSDLEFKYDASGNRIAKVEKPHGSSVENGGVNVPASWKTTYYIRDAQGNVMSNYYYVNPGTASYKLIERDLYGSSRLGTENTQLEMIAAPAVASPFPHALGNKYFEVSNHLGNVISVFTDKKIPRDDNSNGIIDYFQPEVLACNDYTAFGAPMSERSFSSNKYRYGFNGKEKDDEVQGGGNSYDYGFRIYNPRLGRFLSVDPLSKDYPWYTPYQFAANMPIDGIDVDGLEWIYYKVNDYNSKGQCRINVTGEVDYQNWALNLYSKVTGTQPSFCPVHVVEAPDGLHYFFSTAEEAYTATMADFDPHTRYTVEGIQALYNITDAAGFAMMGTVASSIEKGQAPSKNPEKQQANVSKRPTWQKSEKDIVTEDYAAQKSFKNGKPVKYGTKGSVRPEGYKIGESIEVKNYDVTTKKGVNSVVDNVSKQIIQRQSNLPSGTAQKVVIDIRGQKISGQAMQDITNKIITRTRTPNVTIEFKVK